MENRQGGLKDRKYGVQVFHIEPRNIALDWFSSMSFADDGTFSGFVNRISPVRRVSHIRNKGIEVSTQQSD